MLRERWTFEAIGKIRGWGKKIFPSDAILVSAQSCQHRGNIKYGRRICLHCPRTPSRRGETTFTLAELPPSTETSRFLWGSFGMIDAVSIFNPYPSSSPSPLPQRDLSPPLRLSLNFLPPVEGNALFAPLPECQNPGAFYEYRMKREWNEVNTCLVMTSIHFSKNVRAVGKQ